MAWLDRDQMPVRFAMVTSVASGLILTAILNILRADVFKGAALAWIALTIGVVAVISWVAATLFRSRGSSRRTFLMPKSRLPVVFTDVEPFGKEHVPN